MLKENDRLYNNVLAFFDVLISIIAFVLAYYIRVLTVAKSLLYTEQYLILGILIIPVWYILLKMVNLDNNQRIKAYSLVLIEYSIVIFIGISILFAFIFIFKLENISRIAILIFGLIDLILLFIVRIVYYQFLKKKTISGKNTKNVILIADDSSVEFIQKLLDGVQWGYKVFCIISNSEKIIREFSHQYDIRNDKENIDKLIEKHAVDEIIYCKNEIDTEELKHLIYSCQEIGVTLQIQSSLFNLIASKSHVNYFGEIPVMAFKTTSTDYFALSVKAVTDYIVSALAILFFLPFLIIISIIIKLESKGPILFKQKRVGLRGRMFTMYKFRTMVQNAEQIRKELEDKNEADGPVFKIKKDPRITRFGSFLRKTSLDEFPQFFNVLRGDMSIVGPRPPVKEEVEQYERHQLRRLSMKPGITCIWQVSGRNEISFEEWMKMDLRYIDNWSLKYDLILILKTINTIFKKTGY
jgi:exopolysaccharide biosynthesis polyprenyl glycosylphosphotransferase